MHDRNTNENKIEVDYEYIQRKKRKIIRITTSGYFSTEINSVINHQ